MKKSEIKILIVEDDPSSARVLKESLKRSGYNSKVAHRPGEAEKYFSLDDFQLLIVDCMLPQMNGVDLVAKLQKDHSTQFHVIFTSGVFKNSSFARDAIRRTGANHFFHKPFDLEEIVKAIDKLYSDVLEEEKDPLLELMSVSKIINKDLQEAIENTDSIQGRELPLLYGYLFQAKASGILNLVDKNGEASSIHFSNGEIVEVNVKDKTSYFGILLIENGYTSSDEVERNLSLDDKKPIGLRLVDAHALSPHAINVALSQQMVIRLSKTISEKIYSVHFHSSEISQAASKVSRRAFQELLSDWIDSKIDEDWLYRFYLPWMNYRMQDVSHPTQFKKVKDMPILRMAPEIFKYVEAGKSLGRLIERNPKKQHKILSVIHFLVVEKFLTFKHTKIAKADFQHRIHTLQKMARGIENKNHFEVLGINEQARSKEIAKAYIDLAKVLHPDRLESNAPDELIHLTNRVFSFISQAHDVLSNPEKMANYLAELKLGNAEAAFQTESKVESGVAMLSQGRYTEAYSLFKELFQSKARRSDIPIYLTWALLKLPTAPEKKKYIVDKATKLIKKIPPEERHNATFFMVKGMYYAKVGNLDKAIINLKNAKTMDPSLNEAKRELLSIRQKHGPQTKDPDNTGILTTLFRKKA